MRSLSHFSQTWLDLGILRTAINGNEMVELRQLHQMQGDKFGSDPSKSPKNVNGSGELHSREVNL